MTTNPGYPTALSDPKVLAALHSAGESAAWRQTSDHGLVEDAGMHGLKASFLAVTRPDAPEQPGWSAYVCPAAKRYA